jgi:hypothetical protein
MAHRPYSFLLKHVPAAAEGALPDLAVAMFQARYVAHGYIHDPGNNYWEPLLVVTEAGSIHDYGSGRLPKERINALTAKAGLSPWDSMILDSCEGVATVINWFVNFQPNIRGAEAPGPLRTLVETPADLTDIKRMINDVFEQLPAEIAAIYDSIREAPMHPAWRARLWRAHILAEILWDFTYAVNGRVGPTEDLCQFPFSLFVERPERHWSWWCLDPGSVPGFRPLDEAVIFMVDIHT